MRLTYETGIATLIQFIVLAFLNIIDGVYSVIDTCAHQSGSCVTNMLSSVVFYLLIVAWFGVIVGIGFSAQAKRSSRFAKILILAELSVFVVAAYNIKLGISYHNGALTLFTSLIDLVMSVWIITLAYRLNKSGGARVRRRSRVVHTHDHDDDNDLTV